MNDAQCPTCHSRSKFLVDWSFSGLNDSVFNYIAHFYHCNACGLVFVENIDDDTLAKFYIDECSYSEKAHFDINSPENIKKYSHYKNVLVKHDLENQPVTDIGCGRGGFLMWLNQSGWKSDLFGVDVDARSMPKSQSKLTQAYTTEIVEGGALDLPYRDGTQAVLTYFHVLEHIRDIDLVLSEARRVLQNGGQLIIEVPDAERYAEYPVGSAFWIGIREHIYHFSASALISALERNGFNIEQVYREMLPTPEFDYPSLMIIAKKATSKQRFKNTSLSDIGEFVIESKAQLKQQISEISALANQNTQLTFWGFSSELFSLLPLMPNKHYKLCDASRIKQAGHFQGMDIVAPEDVQTSGLLVVAPYLYSNTIEKEALKLGWKPSQLYKLT